MDAADVFGSAWQALGSSKRRTLLSLLGTAIGVAAVVVLTGLAEGARRFVKAQFDVLGSDVIAVLPGKVETSGGIPGFGGVPNPLTLADARAVQRGIPGAQFVAPILLGNAEIAAGDKSRRVLVFGCTEEIVPVRDFEVAAGRFLHADWERTGDEIVIGQGLAFELFGAESALGQRVRVGGWRMRVVGVLGSQGVHFGMNLDETALVPVSTAMRMFDTDALFRILVQLKPGTPLDAGQARLLELLISRHGEEDVTLVTPDAVLAALGGVLNALAAALLGIASISLAVAGVGIMNVMLVSVGERTGEIGLLKAIGGTRRQVLLLFLTEAVLISAAGGISGLVLGSSILGAASLRWPAIPSLPPAWAALAALGVALSVGVLFGLLPALRAMKMEPVVALTRRSA